jgi:hypothetical protein
MSSDEPMAVVAPNLESGPITTAAHVPEVDGQSSDDDVPLAKGNGAGAGSKRAPATGGSRSSSDDEKPLVCVYSLGRMSRS